MHKLYTEEEVKYMIKSIAEKFSGGSEMSDEYLDDKFEDVDTYKLFIDEIPSGEAPNGDYYIYELKATPPHKFNRIDFISLTDDRLKSYYKSEMKRYMKLTKDATIYTEWAAYVQSIKKELKRRDLK